MFVNFVPFRDEKWWAEEIFDLCGIHPIPIKVVHWQPKWKLNMPKNTQFGKYSRSSKTKMRQNWLWDNDQDHGWKNRTCQLQVMPLEWDLGYYLDQYILSKCWYVLKYIFF